MIGLGKVAKLGVYGFQAARGPHLPTCAFMPTCSRYAIEAFESQTFFKAIWLVMKRLGRCHPWGGWGFDPVPEPRAPRQK